MAGSKDKIVQRVDQIADELRTLALEIHAHPELGFKEYTAVSLICGLLEKHGFSVQKGYGGLETSFRADAKGKTDGPTVAFLAEYDALNGCGHGCGHNLIAACSVGAFLGLAAVMNDLAGNICIIGTPAEEGGSGKVKLLQAGAFADVDFAMMMHPSSGGKNIVGRGGRAACGVEVEFFGKGAHSSVPQNGINALSAVIHVFHQIDLLRPTFEPQDNINGIITEGGTAANIIPPYAKCAFCVRADTMKRVEELLEIIRRCVANAEALIGAEAKIKMEDIAAERYSNRPMNQAFKDNMQLLGIEMRWPDPKELCGSSDIGNVSIKMPAIHDYLAITDDPSIQTHTAEFAACAASPQGIAACLNGAKGLAMTGFDILSNKQLQSEIKEYYRQQIPDFYQNEEADQEG